MTKISNAVRRTDTVHDMAIALSAFGAPDGNTPPVERDSSGVPIAWRVVPFGPWTVTRDGETFVLLDVTEEVVASIIAQYKQKGSKVPIDSRHFLYRLAEKYHVEEIDVLRFLPDGAGTFGFGELERRQDGLWITNVEYVPLGRELIAEGIFRYFSPVIRGLSTRNWRVTSLAMENVPATDGQQGFAATAEERGFNDMNTLITRLDAFAANAESQHSKTLKEAPVKKLQVALTGLLGMDSIALGADGDADESVINKINELTQSLPGMRADGAIVGKVRDSLSLGAEAGESEIVGTLSGLVAKGSSYDSMKEKVDSLALEAEEGKLQKLIDQGLESGKLTNDQEINWIRAKKIDSVALAAYLEHAPVVVPQGQIDHKELKPDSDSVALTAEDIAYCQKHGYNQEEFAKSKKK